ncbi:MAG: AraC family transcriptional regulator [Bacteroidetes bacterium 46-16]|nr:MAG: AraC family transcriptional regulator [Bacteroidetes bacterium 46-16]
MANMQPTRIKTISEFHKMRGLQPPKHPLISVVDYALFAPVHGSAVFDYYSISIKRGVGKMFYGQQEYDFDEGVMYFMAPNQVLRVEPGQNENTERSGWILLIHPDFLWNTTLAKKIRQYEFFDYAVNEALFLSEQEEAILNNIILNIQREYQSNIDKFSQDIIIAQLELLLSYSERFYQRQFITRKISNHQVLAQLEEFLDNYFDSEAILKQGLPTVLHAAETLNLSPGYLSGLLKVLTGMNTQQHIHEKLIRKAKERLSTTNLSVSEIAYELGFEHPQSFSKLFKMKTNLSPLAFRQTFG